MQCYIILYGRIYVGDKSLSVISISIVLYVSMHFYFFGIRIAMTTETCITSWIIDYRINGAFWCAVKKGRLWMIWCKVPKYFAAFSLFGWPPHSKLYPCSTVPEKGQCIRNWITLSFRVAFRTEYDVALFLVTPFCTSISSFHVQVRSPESGRRTLLCGDTVLIMHSTGTGTTGSSDLLEEYGSTVRYFCRTTATGTTGSSTECFLLHHAKAI